MKFHMVDQMPRIRARQARINALKHLAGAVTLAVLFTGVICALVFSSSTHY